MKYGLELQENIFTPWRLSYVAYDVLKQELKARTVERSWTDKDEADFIHLLDNELTKVYDFVNAKLAEIDARILYCERTIQTLQRNPTMNSDINYSIMDEALTEILFDVNDLSRFTRVNFTAIQKIIKKHDRWTGYDLKQKYLQKLREKPLDKQRFDVAIVYISALHDICRNRGQRSPGNSASGGDQNAFERATAKYWVHPDNITEVKAIIMLHLPVLVFNKSKKWEPSDSAISSVYFDNENFDLYTGRLQRDEGAEAVRFRWYGPYDTKHAFIERKTHHASWLDGASVKDRFRLSETDINRYCSGQYTAEQIRNQLATGGMEESAVNDVHFIANGVQNSFLEKGLQPILRIFYNRTAFQLPDDQKLRISLDTDMTFVREDHLDGHMRRNNPPNNWRRTDVGIDHPFNYLPEEEVLRFPYAILETKLQTHLGQAPPQWLTKLVDSHLVHEVPRFSKYLHGASHFYREKLALLPWWLSEMSVDIRKARHENIGLTRSRSFKPLIDGRYRRAMIEEKERVRRQSVANATPGIPGSPSEDDHGSSSSRANDSVGLLSKRNVNSITGQQLYDPPQRRRSESIDEQTAAAWRPVTNRKEYSSIDLGRNNQNSAVVQPLLPQNTSGVNGQDSAGPVFNGKRASQSSFLPVPIGNFFSNRDGIYSATSSMEDLRSRDGRTAKSVDDDDTASKKSKKKIKVDPKTFFANERTFISWLQFCALLLTVALTLLNFGDNTAHIVGGIFIGLGAVVAIYALYRFEQRAWMINRRIDGRYDDLWGPAILCVLLVGALVVNFYMRFRP
ncbi:vacuolar transporter chaperone [Apophysomyces sp. BC1034]|nr:vacuolar transporter chaperone [Apophysomyces sp. BC1015]KAG0181061.1 vacuolar transporter chaperone [Apophysomyces sp. BC1021]KAG0191468.1 vacuolar transporter chaperone [Apophysomyces sp. BC1034]